MRSCDDPGYQQRAAARREKARQEALERLVFQLGLMAELGLIKPLTMSTEQLLANWGLSQAHVDAWDEEMGRKRRDRGGGASGGAQGGVVGGSGGAVGAGEGVGGAGEGVGGAGEDAAGEGSSNKRKIGQAGILVGEENRSALKRFRDRVEEMVDMEWNDPTAFANGRNYADAVKDNERWGNTPRNTGFRIGRCLDPFAPLKPGEMLPEHLRTDLTPGDLSLLHLPRLAHLSTLAPHHNHQPEGAASVTLPPCVKSLNFLLSCPHIDTIFPSSSPLTELEELLITNGREFVSLPEHFGDVLPRLRKLTIRNCHQLIRLPESITSLRWLGTLIVSQCENFTLRGSNFGHLPALKLLVLEGVGFTRLPPSFCHLTSLEALSLNSSVIQKLPANFSHLTALKALCLSNLLDLDALPGDLGALANLEALKVYNAILFQPFPASFTKLTSLKSLELRDCFRGQLPKALGELGSLQELKLSFLAIGVLPVSLLRLTRLQTLEVRYCGSLSQVPARLDTLVGLKRLEVTSCRRLSGPLPGLPPLLETLCLGPFKEGSSHVVDLSNLPQLKVLKLNCVGVRWGAAVNRRLRCQEHLEQVNQLELELGREGWEPPVPMTFRPRLRSLVEAPGLSSLPESMAAAFPELRQLSLLSWSPEELPGSIMELPSLTSLEIHAPHLTSLPESMLSLSRLRKLQLVRCRALQCLPEFLTQLKRLQHLVLYRTPISPVPADFVELLDDVSFLS
ncbi:unnamed protein product [Closterium sp. Yama58-4]|nr:unnamed protein product [Closterium sp. Yama58-4]